MINYIYMFKTGREFFDCPNCGGQDVVYIRQPQHCHYCQEPYNFSVIKLEANVKERIKYFIGKDKEIHEKVFS